jgi:hypothetical protein
MEAGVPRFKDEEAVQSAIPLVSSATMAQDLGYVRTLGRGSEAVHGPNPLEDGPSAVGRTCRDGPAVANSLSVCGRFFSFRPRQPLIHRTEQALMAAAPENGTNDTSTPLNRFFSCLSACPALQCRCDLEVTVLWKWR